MPKLFDKAVAAVRKLPPDEQEKIGAILLQELADEEGWSRRLAESRDLLQRMADEAVKEHKAGRTTPMEFPRRR